VPQAYHCHALVLKKTKLGESDLIVTLLSEDGRQLRCVAKGARKPGSRFAARLELFSVAEVFMHQGRSLDTVTDARLVGQGSYRWGSDPARAAAACVLCEFLEKATREGDGEPRLFPLCVEALRCIGTQEHDALELLVAAALLKCAAQMGYRPALYECSSCGEPLGDLGSGGGLGFSLEGGGGLCAPCAVASAKLDPAFLGWLRLLLGGRLADLAALEGAPCGRMLDFSCRWVEAHLGITLRSVALLRDILCGLGRG
jgi:DNA repair protein RecO (recombination protein O)